MNTPRAQDAFWFGLYTGMRLNEVLPLRWRCVELVELVFRVEETKMGAPLELPITRQLVTVLKRRLADGEAAPGTSADWVFPSILPGALGHIADLSHLYGRIGEAGGTRFWYHGLRNVFITVAERDLLLPHALTRRLVNHAPPNDVTEGYAADWTIEQLREPAQRSRRGPHRGAHGPDALDMMLARARLSRLPTKPCQPAGAASIGSQTRYSSHNLKVVGLNPTPATKKAPLSQQDSGVSHFHIHFLIFLP